MPRVIDADPGALEADHRSKASSGETVETVAREIEQREAEYARVRRDARTRGMVGGALQGAVLGLLVDSSGTATIAGAVIGGAVGTAIGDGVGSNVVQNHQNFLVRQASLERVMAAVEEDSSNTSFDLLLATDLVAATQSDETPDVAKLAQAEQSLSDFRQIALTRVVSLQELLPLYEENQAAHDFMVSHIGAQSNMISQFDDHIALLQQQGVEQ